MNNQGSAKYEGLFSYADGKYKVILPSQTVMPDGSYLEYVTETSINDRTNSDRLQYEPRPRHLCFFRRKVDEGCGFR